ncbi:urease accessory protein UreD [Tersicoccus solisilvae]|uniref:Urease accessory protein UreD n=1 Tax=Tersicoccus solisilvae TaxID=1882339 RepID=A0ABQ1P932_9MICC|nr:urease accessory protein UreD [Tersicoccus solisilvae]GGC91788.1 urease accessory protein UreD [Tersicoccus solisilvae]
MTADPAGTAAVPGSGVAPVAPASTGTTETYRGELELTVRRDAAGRSVAAHQYHRGALRVLRPHHLDGSGQVAYVVVNPGGAYLDRDRFRIGVEVAEGASLLLTTQSATKVYRTPGDRATQQLTARLGPGSRLEYLPDQLIAYRGSRYRQETRVAMDPTACLVLSEVVTPGWSPNGEPFLYDRLGLRTIVTMGERPVAVDNLVLAPRDGAAGMTGLGYLEGHSHVGSLLVVDPRVDDAVVDAARDRLAARAGSLTGGVSALAVPGLTMRVLGSSTEQVTGAIRSVVDDLRARWYRQDPVDLRKY